MRKKYVVALMSFFDMEIKQFLVCADNEYEALKKALVLSCNDDESSKEYELNVQKSPQYPKTYEDLTLFLSHRDFTSAIIEIPIIP